MYSTSYMRTVTLNAGGEYATAQKESATATPTATNRYARFTMESVSNSLTKYLFTPSQISWQENESARTVSGKAAILNVTYEVGGTANARGFYDAKTYSVTAQNSNPNYEVTFTAGQLTVQKKQVTVTISDISGVYGTARNNDGFLTVRYADSGFAAGEDATLLGIAFVLEGASQGALLDAGSYGLTGSLNGTEGYSADNYEVTFVGNYENTKGLVTVTAKPVEVVLREEIKVLYGVKPGDEVFLPANIITLLEEGRLRGLVEGDAWDSADGVKFTFSVNTDTALDKLSYGAYAIKVDIAGARSKNYTFTFTTANYFVCAIGLNVFLYSVEDPANLYGTFKDNDAFNTAYINDAGDKIKFIYFDPEDTDKDTPDGGFPAVSEFTYSIADYSADSNLAVGRHSIVAEFRRDVNYQVNIVPGTYIVYPAPIEVTIELASILSRAADKYSKVYDGEDVTLEDVTTKSEEIVFTNGAMVEGDELTFTLTKAPGANVGEYVIVIALKNDPANILLASNYHITYGTGIYRITPRPVTVAVNDQSDQYGSSALDGAQWSVQGEGLVEGQDASVLGVRLSLYKDGAPVADAELATLPVGSYAIVGAWTDTNYAVTFTGSFAADGGFKSVAGTFRVERREVALFADSGTSVYGDEVTVPAWHLGTVSSVLADELDDFETYITVSIEGYTAGKLTAGKHAVTVTYDSEQEVYANYHITATAGEYTVTPRPITVSVDSITETVGVKLADVLPKIVSAVSGEAEGDELHFVYTVLQGDAAIGGQDVIPTGTYVLRAVLAADSAALGENYQINYSDGSLFIVNSNGIVVVVDALTSVYGQALVDLAVLNEEGRGYTVMGANEAELGGLTVTLRYVESVRAAIKDVGTYDGAVEAIVNGVGDNVTIVKGTYTVTAKPVTVTIKNVSQVYGEKEAALTWSVADGALVGGDDTDALGVTLQRVPGEAVGTYAIVGTSAAGNYAVTFRSETEDGPTGTYTVTHRKVTVETQSAASVYGDQLATLTVKVLTGEGLLGLKEGDTLEDLRLTVAIDATWDTYLPYKEGGYPIVCTTSGQVGNYDITVKNSGVYTVSKREVTVTAQSVKSVYGAEAGPFGYALTGELAYGEQIEVAFAVKDHAADERLAVGTYTVTCSFSSIVSSYEGYTPTADNYTFIFQSGELEVERRTANVVVYKQTATYGDSSFSTAVGTAYTVSGVLDGDDLGITIFPADAQGNALRTFNVGTYPISVSGSNANYDVVVSDGEYEIVKRVIEVEIESKSSVYGEATAALTFKLNGSLVAGDSEQDLRITLHALGDAVPAAGSYAITGTSASEKYDVRFVNGTYTVEKRTVEVEIEDKTSFYGEDFQALTFKVLGELVGNDDESVLHIKLNLPEGTLNAGSHIITGTSDSENYTVVFHNGVYIITRADNRWETRFSIADWMEGDDVGEIVAPKAKYGEVTVLYFTDSACTQAYEGDLMDAKAGTYYAQVSVADSTNYSGLSPIVYEFHVESMPSIGVFVVLGVVEIASFVVLIGIAVHFGKKKRK